MRCIVFLSFLILAGLCGPSWAEDCGLRGYDGTDIVKLDCEPDGTTPPSPLRIRTSTGIHGIKLVDLTSPASPEAAKFRVRYTGASGNAVIKAIGLVPISISSCEELQMIGFHPKYPRILVFG